MKAWNGMVQVFAALRGTPSTVAASVSAAASDTLLAGDAVILMALMQVHHPTIIHQALLFSF